MIAFFVLSSFVIVYITDTEENTLPNYTASRISFVCSVARSTVFLTLAWPLALGSLFGIVLFHQAGIAAFAAQAISEGIGEHWYVHLAYSKYFLGDWLVGVLVLVNFTAMRVGAPKLAPVLLAIERPVRLLVGYTLTLYLMHQALLFWSAAVHGDPYGYGYWWAIKALVAVPTALIGHLTGQRRGALKR